LNVKQSLSKLRNKGRRQKAISSIVGGVIMFAVMFTVGSLYFYTLAQSEQFYLQSSSQNGANVQAQQSENLAVTGTLIGPALGFYVNNTGISSTIISYFIANTATGQQVQYNTGGLSTPSLPYALSQGQGVVFNTGIVYVAGLSYTIKVLTARGSSFIGTYPPKQLTVQAVNAVIAYGLGSISMNFGTFSYYSYTRTSGPPIVDLSHPYEGALTPYGVNMVLGVNITNNDPSGGSITIDSHSDVWTYQTCTFGCGTSPVIFFYVVNVASNGTITSTAQNSFSPILIPFGATKELYFASANDLALSSFSTQAITSKHGCGSAGCGEYDVFVILSGTDAGGQSTVLYEQNLPFAATYVADNLAWYAENPTSCSQGTTVNFTLTVTNSQFSGDAVEKVILNAGAFSSIWAKAPAGWSKTVSSGTITWSGVSLGGSGSKASQAFSWSGVATPAMGSLTTFPLTINFDGGTVTSEQVSTGCYLT
jgi:hypothetical protein